MSIKEWDRLKFIDSWAVFSNIQHSLQCTILLGDKVRLAIPRSAQWIVDDLFQHELTQAARWRSNRPTNPQSEGNRDNHPLC